MIIFSDGMGVILAYVTSFGYTYLNKAFVIHMVDGSNITLELKVDIETFLTAIKNFYKDKNIIDLTK